MGGKAPPRRKLKCFWLSHLLFSVLVCRLIFKTLISKFYCITFLKKKNRQCSTPFFNIGTSNFLGLRLNVLLLIITIMIMVILIIVITIIVIIIIIIIIIIIMIYACIYY